MVKPEQDLLASDNEEASANDEAETKQLVINKRYAKDFQIRKQREDLRKHDMDNDDASAASSSTSSSEDEEGALLTTRLDTDILKTIHALRSKDARIYDPQVRFFDENDNDANDYSGSDKDDEGDNNETRASRKPKRYKDVVREQALEQIEKERRTSDSDDSDDNGKHTFTKDRGVLHRLAYDKEQEELRKNFLQSTQDSAVAAADVDDDDDDDDERKGKGNEADDGLLVVKKKSIRKDEGEEEEFLQQVQQIESTLNKDADYVDPKGEVDNGSQFLWSYFKNRAWIDKDDNESDDEEEEQQSRSRSRSKQTMKEQAPVETDEVLPMKTGEKDGNESDDASLDHLDQSDDFEAQYNFRFEQAAARSQSGADYSLMSYARGSTVDTLRRKDDSRREKRLARKERKAAERKAKEEELKRLKNLKRQEMERKLHKVKKVVGLLGEEQDGGASNGGGELDEAAIMKLIEGDYDPEEFEQKMQETFGDDFYATQDQEWKSDKDVRESLLKDEDGNLLVGQGNEKDGDLYDTAETEGDDDEVENDDTENDWEEEEYYDEEGQQAEDTKETELERKIKSKMEDELYKLDYEDIIAGMPTRFKYRQVEPNDYGLTTEEILFSRDTTLKQFVSLKKMAPYREDGEFNVGGRRRRRFRDILKHEIEEEMKESSDQQTEPAMEDTEAVVEGTSKKRKRRRNKKSKLSTNNADGQDNDGITISPGVEQSVDEKSKQDANKDTEGRNEEQEDQAPQQKRKRRRSKKNKSSSAAAEDHESSTAKKEESKTTGIPPKVSDESSSTFPDNVEAKETLVDLPNDESADQKISLKEKPKKKHKKHKHKHEESKDKKKKKKKKSKIEGIPTSRLSSYGL